jgi:hypothetical protein
MSKRASVVVFGLVAAGSIAQGLIACNGDDSSSTGSSNDAGSDVTAADGATSGPPQCSGTLPEMMAFDPTTNAEVTPDWSCYANPEAGFLDLDAGTDADDAAADTSDAAQPDSADAGESDSATASDAPNEASPSDEAGVDAGPDAAGAATTLQINDFVSHAAVEGASVDYFFSPRTVSGTPDLSGTTDKNGQISFPLPAANPLFAYRVKATSTLVGLIEYDNIAVKPPAFAQGYSATNNGVSLLLAGVLGSSPQAANSSIIVVGVRDCQEREIRGALVELVDGNTGNAVPTGKGVGDMRTDYFLGGLPNTKCTFTNDDQALWGAVNAPVNMPGNTHPYRVRVSGRKQGGTDPVMINEIPIELWPNQIIIPRAYKATPPK